MLNPGSTIQQKPHKCLKHFYLSKDSFFSFEHITSMQLQSFIIRDCWKGTANEFAKLKHAKLQTSLKRLVAEQAAQAIDLCELLQPQANILLGYPWLRGREQRSSHPPGSSSAFGKPICYNGVTPRVPCPVNSGRALMCWSRYQRWATELIRVWSTHLMRSGWGSWAC